MISKVSHIIIDEAELAIAYSLHALFPYVSDETFETLKHCTHPYVHAIV